jgi:hypothetical protein
VFDLGLGPVLHGHVNGVESPCRMTTCFGDLLKFGRPDVGEQRLPFLRVRSSIDDRRKAQADRHGLETPRPPEKRSRTSCRDAPV